MRRDWRTLFLFLVLVGCKDKETGSEGTVSPGDEEAIVWTLSVTGEDEGTAGEVLTYVAAVSGEDGTDHTDDASFSLHVALDDGSEEAADGLSWTPTLVGSHVVTVTAALDGSEQSESLTVSIGPGVLSVVDLALSDTSADIGGSITATVTLTDAWGNEVDGTPVLSGDPSDGLSIDDMTATFNADGAYIFTAEVEAVTGTAGPVYVDSGGPLVVLTSPSRGEWIEGSSTTVSGTVIDSISGVGTLMLNDESIAVDSDLSFSHEISLVAGANVLAFAVTDGNGNAADSLLGVMASGEGTFDDADLTESIVTHLNQSGLDVISEAMAATIDVDAIEDELISANPAADESLGCMDVEVEVTGFSMDDPTATVTPDSSGLTLTITADDLDVDLYFDTYVCWYSATDTGEITADSVEIEVDLDVTLVSPGDFSVEVADTTVTFTNFEEDYGTLSTVLSTLGYTVSDLGLDVETMIADQIEAEVESAVPGELEDALETIAIEETMDLLDGEATLEAEVTAIETDSTGIALLMDAIVTTDGTHADIPTHPGSLVLASERPEAADEPGLLLSMSLDVFNRLLEQLWDNGALNTVMTQEDLGVDDVVVDLVFKGATDLKLELYPQLPPALMAGTGDQPLDFKLVELQLYVWGQLEETETLLTVASLHVTAGAEPTLEDEVFGLTLVDPVVALDVITEDEADVNADEELEELLALLAASLADQLVPDIAVAMPELDGFLLSVDSVDVEGDAGDWLVVGGDLSAD